MMRFAGGVVQIKNWAIRPSIEIRLQQDTQLEEVRHSLTYSIATVPPEGHPSGVP
jgi:hypothetical protein